LDNKLKSLFLYAHYLFFNKIVKEIYTFASVGEYVDQENCLTLLPVRFYIFSSHGFFAGFIINFDVKEFERNGDLEIKQIRKKSAEKEIVKSDLYSLSLRISYALYALFLKDNCFANSLIAAYYISIRQ
jgi:hypothetical protein